jgi:hypothetical protein
MSRIKIRTAPPLPPPTRWTKRLFKGSPDRDRHTLLKGPSTELADAMEANYHNILTLYRVNELYDTKLSPLGIFKARLFGATFMLYPFASKWKDEAELQEMINMSSGLAITPFGSSEYEIELDRDAATSVADNYMRAVFKEITFVMKCGPERVRELTFELDGLSNFYKDAFRESLGEERNLGSSTRSSGLVEIDCIVRASVCERIIDAVEWTYELLGIVNRVISTYLIKKAGFTALTPPRLMS